MALKLRLTVEGREITDPIERKLVLRKSRTMLTAAALTLVRNTALAVAVYAFAWYFLGWWLLPIIGVLQVVLRATGRYGFVDIHSRGFGIRLGIGAFRRRV